MSSLTQNLVNPNTQPLVIGEFSIRQDEEGRYSLADLHKASGNLAKHKPSNFLRVEQTQELINEIEQFSDMRSAVKVINGGNNRGTYAVKEMVYAYAMWISAKFHLMVIRAYDAMVMKALGSKSEQLKIEDKTTKQERVPLKDAVNLLVAKSKFLNYPDAYGLIHQRFGVKHIEEIPYDQIPVAVEYVHHLIGEYIPKIERIDPEQRSLELLAADTTNKVHDWIYSLCEELKRLKGNVPEFPVFDKETIARAVVTRIVQGQRMLLTVGYQTGKPEIQFVPSNAWILDDQNIAKMIGDREGPKKELLPDIIEAAVKRLTK
ncbi:KilA-N domain-containing protein [Acinetobacter sp. P8-3-8]|uniref:KilA-N domain-containing protein n=1 Tax=Acinetobacter sp. P8-3-8 TaxID=1029823 RepID=UPI0005505B5D|nr:KilA-N domain-containing protein [Acinetobacter sp. P8-3-8]